MIYISFKFYIFLIATLLIYYILPLKLRWLVLLASSMTFYISQSGKNFWLLLVSAFIAYAYGIAKKKGKLILFLSILLTSMPLLVIKIADFMPNKSRSLSWLSTLGLAFYTLTLISYIVDIYKGIIEPQRNPFKFLLYVSFFPHIIQGPIPRYNRLAPKLYEGHKFDETVFSKGLQLIIWGFFLKLVIADKCAILVNNIFDNVYMYSGMFFVLGAVFFTIQLYTDFLGCVTICQGVAETFGITLDNNFNHPLFSRSIKEFWRRWHLSLSSWLKDYIYIPLGGNKKGTFRKYINILITFGISGLWHGAGIRFIIWGLIHGFYQIIGDLTKKTREFIYYKLKIEKDCLLHKIISTVTTFSLVTISFIVFRANSLKETIYIFKSILTTFNPWVILGQSKYLLGLDVKDYTVLIFALIILLIVSIYQEKQCIRDAILAQALPIRWTIYIASILFIFLFGTYGFGFNAADFIYGGF